MGCTAVWSGSLQFNTDGSKVLKISVNFYQATRRHIPENGLFNLNAIYSSNDGVLLPGYMASTRNRKVPKRLHDINNSKCLLLS
jgi:hypothetical protein